VYDHIIASGPHAPKPRPDKLPPATASALTSSSTTAQTATTSLDPDIITTTSTTGTQPSAPTPTLAIGMQDMIEAIRATIDIAARQGLTQARIALEPEELGHISIRLSQTSDGLLARVSAETPAAVQALTANRAELHQSLSSLGVSLVRLDISSFGQSQAGLREDRSAGDTNQPTNPSNRSTDAEEAEDVEASTAPASAASAPTARSALVDVLA
jgi:flagellar hook-length control protein FliK